MRHVCLIGSGDRTVELAQRQGMRVLLVQWPGRIRPDALRRAERSIVVDKDDAGLLVRLVAAVHEHDPLDGVYSFTEHGSATAARLAAAVGVDGLSMDCVSATRDKGVMRDRLARAGLSPVASRVCSTPEEAAAFGRSTGYPVILKTTNGSGKDGLALAERDDDCLAAFDRLRNDGPSTRILAEEYLSGPEVSVETISVNGEHRVLAITDKAISLPSFHEVGHCVPSALPGNWQDEIADLAVLFLEAIEVSSAICHTEMRFTTSGPRIIESHVRPGGDNICELVRLATGVDPYGTFFSALAGGKLPEPAPAQRAAAIRFLPATDAGTVTALSDLEPVTGMDGLHRAVFEVEVGREVPVATMNSQRRGYAIATGSDADQAIRRAEAAVSAMRLTLS